MCHLIRGWTGLPGPSKKQQQPKPHNPVIIAYCPQIKNRLQGLRLICYKPCVRIEFLAVLLGYFLLLLLVGIAFARKTRSLEDYFFASRNLSGTLIFFSVSASWIGASSTLVTVDEAYYAGLSSFWVMGLPAILTAVCFALIFSGPIRRLPIVTLPDLVEMRYGPLVRHLVAFLIVWYMVLLAASQMVALGKFLGGILGMPYLEALILGTAVVVLYSVIGGFFSVTLTDALQFLLLSAGLIWLFFMLLGRVSFSDVTFAAGQLGKEGFWDFFYGWQKNVWIVVSFVCAWVISPIVWQRIQAAKSPRHARHGLLGAAVAFLLIYGMIVSIGMLSLPFLPSAAQSKPLLTELISVTGPVVSCLLFIAVAAAVMSTLDTALNTGALSLTRDVVQRLFRRGLGTNALPVSRISTLAVAALALLVASRLQSILQALGLASEILAEGFFIPGMAMLFMKRRAPAAGLLSVTLGGGYAVLAFFSATGLVPLALPEWPFSVPYGLALSLIGFLAGMAWDRMRSAAPLPPQTDDI